MPIEFSVADLLAQPVDAIVNAANEGLVHGGGIAAVISRAAGHGFDDESHRAAPCPTGDAVVTGAGDLPQRAVIHAVGPVWEGGDAGEPALLASCHRAVVARAAEQGFVTIGLPAISTGVFGYPIARAAPVAIGAVAEALAVTPAVRLVRFCFLDPATREVYAEAAAALGVS